MAEYADRWPAYTEERAIIDAALDANPDAVILHDPPREPLGQMDALIVRDPAWNAMTDRPVTETPQAEEDE